MKGTTLSIAALRDDDRAARLELGEVARLEVLCISEPGWFDSAMLLADIAAGTSYQLADGTSGTVTVFKPLSHLRLKWQPPGWQRPSIMQVRVTATGERTVIAFHQEHLPDATAREERRAHFAAVLDQLEQRLQNET